MNILYIAGESSNWVINLCNKFCENGHMVTSVVQNLDEYDKENPITPHKNLTQINVSYDELFDEQVMVDKLMPHILENKYNIIFGSHAPIAPLVRYLGNTYKIPWGVMLLDIPTHLMKYQRFRMKQWSSWFNVMKYADAIIFNTHTARDEYNRYTGQWFSDEYIIPYAINMPKEYDLAGIDIKGDYVISVCRLTPFKNCRIIPEALKYLDNPKKYVAVGRIANPAEFNTIKENCKKYGIEFIHYPKISEKEKFELIKNSSMLIYPQNTEYIGGLSPFEAMYCGKPVIVKDLKILKDLYEYNTEYFDGYPVDLAQKIAFMQNLKLNSIKDHLISANKYAKVIASFEVMANRMLKVFEKVKK